MDNKQNNKKKYRAIGNRINTLAAKANIKQKDLAKILGVHENVISYYYSGERRPDIDKLIILADYFNTSVDYILGRTDIESVDADIKMIIETEGVIEDQHLDHLTNRLNMAECELKIYRRLYQELLERVMKIGGAE